MDVTKPYDDSVRRLVALVLELGSEEADASRKSAAGRSFAKTEILLHAMPVFNRQGLEETSVQDILDAAHISRRTFYKYFSGKIDVLENIYALALRVMMARFDAELSAATTARVLLRDFVRIYFDYLFSIGRIVGLMMEESLRSGSPLADRRRHMLDRIVVILQREFSRLGMLPQDYWKLMGLLWALEGASLHLLTRTPLPPDDVEACKRGLLALWESSLAV